MADKKVSAVYVSNPIAVWDGTEILFAVKAGADAAGLASTLATYISANAGLPRGVAIDLFNVPTLL